MLAALPGQLRDALAEGDPSLYRLFPPAFTDDDAANEDYARLVGQGLVEGKLLALGELERTAHAETLTEADLGAWLGALESLRLALGTQLDITEESYVALRRERPGRAAACPVPLAELAAGGSGAGALELVRQADSAGAVAAAGPRLRRDIPEGVDCVAATTSCHTRSAASACLTSAQFVTVETFWSAYSIDARCQSAFIVEQPSSGTTM